LNIIGIIPARMAATRFPNKPLEKINGMPMIGHVYHRAKICHNLSDIYVATCDEEIVDYINSIGGKSIMTKDTHERATDRTGEALEIIMNKDGCEIDGVLMIQGDEPLLNPVLLDNMISFHMNQGTPFITNLISKIHSIEEFNNPNVVKAVMDKNGRVLYFSRSPIPSNAKYSRTLPMWKQLGLILFSKDAILSYTKLIPAELEIIESVDMNRILENNLIITAFPTEEISHAVDTPEDILVVDELMLTDNLINSYS
jgi:3-deoxy-manno-octulosonate cytidylyltransferase (CMP-KDO synthetase)